MPNSPVNIDVKQFNPKWKLNKTPTRFNMYIEKPPNTELSKTFDIFFNGTKKIFPTIKITIKHAK